ncbi:hypothetical protein J6590_027456 [Homalodisca vitripennis]|nr:hypothetical protein J6590_027456 [Homalodisca vitripennis]
MHKHVVVQRFGESASTTISPPEHLKPEVDDSVRMWMLYHRRKLSSMYKFS